MGSFTIPQFFSILALLLLHPFFNQSELTMQQAACCSPFSLNAAMVTTKYFSPKQVGVG